MRAKGLTSRLIAGAVGALALIMPAAALAEVGQSTSESSSSAVVTSATTTSTVTTSEAVSTTTASEATATGTPTQSTSSTATTSTRPEVQAQAPQRQTSGTRASGTQNEGAGAGGGSAGHGKSSPGPRRSSKSALPPGIAGRNGAAPLPFSLRTPISGLPSLFLEAYDVPPFLLPIYQAAGIAYGVPWQVLAAINEVETNYGRDLNISSAGAEGWMQFLPSEWGQWGVDAGSTGYMDPYNPADAIFAAARYLSAAGGAAHIRSAVYAYNHSQSYVESVMLRAQLLGGMPPEMLGAVTDLAEARFPVHSAAHFADGYATGSAGKTLAGTTIYGEPGAPVIAVKDGTIVSIGSSPSLGLHISLRDANGDLFTYADLGEVASLYPVLAPRAHLVRIAAAAARKPRSTPSQAATAGVQPHAPLSMAAVQSGFTFGVIEGLGRTAGAVSPRRRKGSAARPLAPRTSSFLEGPERVYLRTLRPGVTVIAGTVLGHLASTAESHILFQVRPAGNQSPLIDPKPLLDSWVALEGTGIYGAKGESPFLSVSPTAGQALLESKGELQQQVLRDKGIRLVSCERDEVEAGRIDRRVLATLELLSVSGLQPTVKGLRCDAPARGHGELDGYKRGEAFDVTAVNGTPIVGHAAPGAVADLLERKLLDLQGTMKPAQIAGPVAYLGARDAVSLPASQDLVHVAFPPATPGQSGARIATAGTPLAGSEWTALDERLAEIPDPGVPQGSSAASIPDPSGAQEGAG
jgi:murein DD-endopeptidase MepM/ murein hydrolase activator NlpD